MQLKNILFYTFFIFTSSSLSTLATTDRMQETLTQETSNQLKNKKDSFYEYDVVDYLCTYKLESTIRNFIEYIVSFFLYYIIVLDNNMSLNIFIAILVIVHFIIIIIYANLYIEGVNSFKNRFVFWLKNISMRGTIPVIEMVCFDFVLTQLFNNNNYSNQFIFIMFSLLVIDIFSDVAICNYPEKAKSILYGSSNKFPKAKGASK